MHGRVASRATAPYDNTAWRRCIPGASNPPRNATGAGFEPATFGSRVVRGGLLVAGEHGESAALNWPDNAEVALIEAEEPARPELMCKYHD